LVLYFIIVLNFVKEFEDIGWANIILTCPLSDCKRMNFTMHSIDFKKQILPHVVAVFIFMIITVGYFNPVFFENKEISQYDILQWEGSAKELIDFRKQTGEEMLWTNSMFSGMPAYLINVEWSNKPIEYLHRVYTIGLPHPVRMIFASFLSFYILLLAFGVRPYLAIGVSVAFGLSSFMLIGIAAGHNARIGAIAYIPLVIAGIHVTITKFRWTGFGVTAAAMALHLRLNHLQMTYYMLLMVLVYGMVMLYYSWKSGQLKAYFINISVLVVAILMAIGSMFGELWATWEYGKYSMRGKSELAADITTGTDDGLKKDYAFQYSNSVFEPVTLIIPNFMGGASANFLVSDPDSKTYAALRRAGDQQTANQLARLSGSYWGKQPLTAPYYAGAIIGFFFILGIIVADRKLKIWLLITFSLGVMLSWGSNFQTVNYFIFDYFPGYNKFRSVTFTIIMAIFSMGLLGGIGLEKIFRMGAGKKIQKQLLTAVAISAGICLLLIGAADMINMQSPADSQLPVWFVKALEADRASLLRADAFRSMVFIGIAFGIIWFTLKKNISMFAGTMALALLITVDMWSAGHRYLKEDNFDRNPKRAYFAETEADKTIKQDQTLSYRVYNLLNPWNEARTSYHHKSIGGYHGAKIRRYQDLYDHALQPQTQELVSKLQAGISDFSDLDVINMLNALYFYAGNKKTGVFRNPSAFGNAWFVKNINPVQSPDDELNSLQTLDLRSTAVIDITKFPAQEKSFDDSGTINLASYTPNQLTYQYQANGDALAVFSEIYYPEGWIATIDDKEVDIFRANYVLRALMLPAGNHTITFSFKPNAYFTGNKIMAVFSILVVIVLLASVVFSIRQRPAVTE